VRLSSMAAMWSARTRSPTRSARTGAEVHVAIGDLAATTRRRGRDVVEAALAGWDILINNAGGTASGGGYAHGWTPRRRMDRGHQGNVVCGCA